MTNEELSSYFDSNRRLWNEKTKAHVDSAFYDNASFLKGRNSLNSFEMEYLQDVKGKKVLHVQCHFGQDSISLARLGAQVTATDISDVALAAARDFNAQCGTDVTFVQTDTYSLMDVIDEQYELIFMSYGVITWLPDLDRLAKICDRLLAPGGRVLLTEFHPMLMTFDFDTNDITYGYRNLHVYEEEIQSTYAQAEGERLIGTEHFWQHSLEESMMAFVRSGMQLKAFREYYSSPYNIFGSMKEIEGGHYVYGDFKHAIPHVYLMEFLKG